MSKKGKGKGKKGDEELEEEMRQLLKYDIETLENNIHYEKTRELNAINDYNRLLEQTKLQQKTIDELKETEGTKLSSKGASLKKEEESNFNSLNILEMEIRKLDIDIEDLEKKIEDKKQVYEKEEKDKDEAINNQSLLFQEMTVRFQHILENTANKLQERVKTGN
jgi:hypothetical protein